MAYFNSGSFYKQLKDYEKAIIEYNKALEKNVPLNWQMVIYLNLGYSYELLNRIEDAKIYYNNALEKVNEIIALQKDVKKQLDLRMSRLMFYFLLDNTVLYNEELNELLNNEDENIRKKTNEYYNMNMKRENIVQ
jgi:tetratricopeptide (TPR) repeat protein